jgi:tRNA (guanine37-N1)-methyltransferase
LLSGNHQHIQQWRLEQSLRRTKARRPELLDNLALTAQQREILNNISNESDDDCES